MQRNATLCVTVLAEVYDKHGRDVFDHQQACFLGTLDFSGSLQGKNTFEAIRTEEQSGYFSVQFPSISVSHWLHPEGVGQLHSQIVSPSPKWVFRNQIPCPIMYFIQRQT